LEVYEVFSMAAEHEYHEQNACVNNVSDKGELAPTELQSVFSLTSEPFHTYKNGGSKK
jgi:hypothetical protein